MKRTYIIPNCKTICMSSEHKFLLELTVYDEETEIIGTKGGVLEEDEYDMQQNVWEWK